VLMGHWAPQLYKALSAARESIARGERDCTAIKQTALRVLRRAPEIRIEYLELVDPDTIRPVEVVSAPVLAALAVWLGKTRLIDNILCEPPPRSGDSNLIFANLCRGSPSAQQKQFISSLLERKEVKPSSVR
jgi:Pantoate-beta-alanine ligase